MPRRPGGLTLWETRTARSEWKLNASHQSAASPRLPTSPSMMFLLIFLENAQG